MWVLVNALAEAGLLKYVPEVMSKMMKPSCTPGVNPYKEAAKMVYDLTNDKITEDTRQRLQREIDDPKGLNGPLIPPGIFDKVNVSDSYGIDNCVNWFTGNGATIPQINITEEPGERTKEMLALFELKRQNPEVYNNYMKAVNEVKEYIQELPKDSNGVLIFDQRVVPILDKTVSILDEGNFAACLAKVNADITNSAIVPATNTVNPNFTSHQQEEINLQHHTNQFATEMAFSGDGVVHPVTINDIRSTLNSRIKEINTQQKDVNCERNAVAGAPLTKEQAEKLAASDYVKGEDKKLNHQSSDLKIKQDKLKTDEKSIMDYGKEHGLDKTLWRHAPEIFKGEGLKYYESSLMAIDHNKKVFDKQGTELQGKIEQLQERLSTPEARSEIAKKSEQYLVIDKERLAKLEPLDSKLSELKKEQIEITQLKNTLPSRKSENEINLHGDVKDVKNVLQQTSQIKQQMVDMQQTIGHGQSRSR